MFLVSLVFVGEEDGALPLSPDFLFGDATECPGAVFDIEDCEAGFFNGHCGCSLGC